MTRDGAAPIPIHQGVTAPGHTDKVIGARARARRDPVPAAFLREAALGLAAILPEDRDRGNLTLPLGVSTWIARSDVDLDQARDGLLELRSGLLEASGLDRDSEPVPLLGGDRRTSVLSLTVYLDGLVERGARRAGMTRQELATQVLALVAA